MTSSIGALQTCSIWKKDSSTKLFTVLLQKQQCKCTLNASHILPNARMNRHFCYSVQDDAMEHCIASYAISWLTRIKVNYEDANKHWCIAGLQHMRNNCTVLIAEVSPISGNAMHFKTRSALPNALLRGNYVMPAQNNTMHDVITTCYIPTCVCWSARK